MKCRYCGVTIVEPQHPWSPQKCTKCQISDSHDTDEKIQRIDRLRRDKARLMKFIRRAMEGSYAEYGRTHRAFKNEQIKEAMK